MVDVRIAGLRDISSALGTSPVQTLRWAGLAPSSRPLVERYRDPLRLRSVHGVLAIRRSRLDAWRNRNQRNGTGERRIFGWTAICKHIGMRRSTATTACGWPEDPLPVVRPAEGRVWAYESALTDWCEAHEHAYGVHRLVSAARRLAAGAPASEPRRWRKGAKAQSGEPGATGTARVGVAHVPGEYRSQVESAAPSSVPQRPVSRGSRSKPSGSRRYDESGIRRDGGGP